MARTTKGSCDALESVWSAIYFFISSNSRYGISDGASLHTYCPASALMAGSCFSSMSRSAQ